MVDVIRNETDGQWEVWRGGKLEYRSPDQREAEGVAKYLRGIKEG